MSKKAVIKAIEEMGNEATVTDVVAATGLPPDLVGQLLNLIAAETGGHLAVTNSGTILYCFSPGFKMHYLTRGARRLAGALAKHLFGLLFLLFRLSFGLMLIGSIFVVYGLFYLFYAILGVITGASGAADQMRVDFMDILKKLALTELFFWEKSKENKGRARGFLMNCFSYLFGQGDPNADLEDRRWKLLAQVIRENEGVVTAEIIAPYFGANADEDKHFLSVLARFNGIPTVTDTGNIVYIFPSLTGGRRDPLQDLLPLCLEEKPWQFTDLPGTSMRGVYVLVAINFLGSLILLWYWLHVLPEKQWSGLPLSAFILGIYGSLFLLIPLARLLAIKLLNRRVRARNYRYRSFAGALDRKSPELSAKLIEAETIRLSQRCTGVDKVIYTTEKDSLEQEL